MRMEKIKNKYAHVDLMVMQRSCSSLRVSVKRVSPALAPAIIPALETRESVRVDFPEIQLLRNRRNAEYEF